MYLGCVSPRCEAARLRDRFQDGRACIDHELARICNFATDIHTDSVSCVLPSRQRNLRGITSCLAFIASRVNTGAWDEKPNVLNAWILNQVKRRPFRLTGLSLA